MDVILELKQRMLFLEQAHASARMGHFVLDPKRQTIEFSSWVRENLGLNDMPIPLERLPELVPEDEKEQFAARVDHLIAREEGFSFETKIVNAKGDIRIQHVSGIPAFSDDRNRRGLIGYYGILREITAEKEAQQELISARDNARAELAARSNILAAVSHEIRTPLGGVLGIIEQLRRERSATERERALTLMEDSCQVLLDTLDAILQQARLSQDVRQREAKRFRPNAVAQRVAELFRPLARRKALRIEVDATSDSEAIGDPGRIQQVLANFVSNAVKFTQSGKISIFVRQPERAGEDWVFEVADTGAGMDDKRIANIFEPYDTSGIDSLGRSVGAGLGLSIARELVDSMGGHIEVESALGRGSSFAVFLPLDEVLDTREECDLSAPLGTVCIAVEKATESVQVDAIASQLGFVVTDPDEAMQSSKAWEGALIVIADQATSESLPRALLDRSMRIILLVEDKKSMPAALDQAKVEMLSSASIARTLPEALGEALHGKA